MGRHAVRQRSGLSRDAPPIGTGTCDTLVNGPILSYADPAEYIRYMYDLLYLALRTNTTRFASSMTESEPSTGDAVGAFATRAMGYKGATHDMAQKRPNESGLWDHWRVKQHACFLQRLCDTPVGDGNMLDDSVVLWGSAHPHAFHSTNPDYSVRRAKTAVFSGCESHPATCRSSR